MLYDGTWSNENQLLNYHKSSNMTNNSTNYENTKKNSYSKFTDINNTNNNNEQYLNNINKKNKPKKKVTFNERVDVIEVESYKIYNLIEDEPINSLEDYYYKRYKAMVEDNNNVNRDSNKCSNCSCIIL